MNMHHNCADIIIYLASGTGTSEPNCVDWCNLMLANWAGLDLKNCRQKSVKIS
jgi:hypothetical protein